MKMPEYFVKAFKLGEVTKAEITYEETEAIPIEYIFVWATEVKGYEQYQVSDIINQLINDWRKENE